MSDWSKKNAQSCQHIKVWWYASYCHKSHKKAKTTLNLSASFYPKSDISSSSVPQSSIFVPKLLKNTLTSCTVALGDVFLHHHEHTHFNLLWLSPTYIVLLPQILTRTLACGLICRWKQSPTKCSVPSCLRLVFKDLRLQWEPVGSELSATDRKYCEWNIKLGQNQTRSINLSL